jgi:hypothetical protein
MKIRVNLFKAIINLLAASANAVKSVCERVENLN